MKINSHNEWDKLREIIVGNADARAGLIFHSPGPVPEKLLNEATRLAREAFPDWIVEEIKEDLEELCQVLRKAGVKVFRPNSQDIHKVYSTPNWSAVGETVYNMRDLHLVVGNTVIESPSQEQHRYFEATGLYDVWYEYLKEGFVWIAGPKPRLAGDYKVVYYEDGKKYTKLGENEILFEAANTVKMGRDLLYLVSKSGNYLGAQWLQSVLGDDYRVHTTEKIYRSNHIDSTVLCLKPGLVLLNATRVDSSNCPEILDKWDKVYFSDIVTTPAETMQFHEKVRKPVVARLAEMGVETTVDGLASDWIGINFLSIDPETVIVDKRQTGLIKVLEKHKLTPVPISFRHSYMMGGIHCSTLDTVRDSKLESYFD